ncbi:MAG: TolC family protein [Bacteroidota bacterium]|nr:TolC family protein [Bacteroidota bacterium]
MITKLNIFLIMFLPIQLWAQNTKLTLDLSEVIQIASEQSYDALIAKNTYLGSYWEYRTYKADYLPSLTLSGTPLGFDRSISTYINSEGEQFYSSNSNNSTANLSLRQNIGLTGGNIYMRSGLQRIDQFTDSTTNTNYSSSPVIIGFSQPLFGFNSLKWNKKIMPLKYKEAQKKYLEAKEQISIKAIMAFFDLSLAQINLEIAKMNYNNTDTLYHISQGRYNIGTIALNELLQMELGFLKSKSNLEESRLDLEVKKFRLRSFLGYNETVNIELIIPETVPDVEIPYNIAIQEALENNSNILSYQRQLIQANRNVAQAKANRGFSANLFTEYGLNQSAPQIADVYKDPDNSLQVNIGLSVPILDWGKGRGGVKMAESNREVIFTSVRQNRIDFEQDVYLKVMQFNMQDDQLTIAAKADTIAQFRYRVTKQRFLIGKIDVMELNNALAEKDQNRRQYISALRNYYSFYYNLRKLSLYDFIENKTLLEDFSKLEK